MRKWGSPDSGQEEVGTLDMSALSNRHGLEVSYGRKFPGSHGYRVEMYAPGTGATLVAAAEGVPDYTIEAVKGTGELGFRDGWLLLIRTLLPASMMDPRVIDLLVDNPGFFDTNVPHLLVTCARSRSLPYSVVDRAWPELGYTSHMRFCLDGILGRAEMWLLERATGRIDLLRVFHDGSHLDMVTDLLDRTDWLAGDSYGRTMLAEGEPSSWLRQRAGSEWMEKAGFIVALTA